MYSKRIPEALEISIPFIAFIELSLKLIGLHNTNTVSRWMSICSLTRLFIYTLQQTRSSRFTAHLLKPLFINIPCKHTPLLNLCPPNIWFNTLQLVLFYYANRYLFHYFLQKYFFILCFF